MAYTRMAYYFNATYLYELVQPSESFSILCAFNSILSVFSALSGIHQAITVTVWWSGSLGSAITCESASVDPRLTGTVVPVTLPREHNFSYFFPPGVANKE
ncbi:hypothetical protein E2C01_045956 [Portunus trituberculatus]|uniref:Uncharacterized protein n=1 Tax=Portunus trituberculatus TaxID=210409 RepID=A0A5B7G2S0_PORTR|nr:hypothetical protein [Portunus trituberculatus]